MYLINLYRDLPVGTYLFYAECERELIETLMESGSRFAGFVQFHLHGAILQYSKYILVTQECSLKDPIFECKRVLPVVERCGIALCNAEVEALKALDNFIPEFDSLLDGVSMTRVDKVLEPEVQDVVYSVALRLRVAGYSAYNKVCAANKVG